MMTETRDAILSEMTRIVEARYPSEEHGVYLQGLAACLDVLLTDERVRANEPLLQQLSDMADGRFFPPIEADTEDGAYEPSDAEIADVMAVMPGTTRNMTPNEDRLRRAMAIEYLKRTHRP